MRLLRYVAPSLCILFSLYCVIWGLIAPSLSTVYRIDGVLFGGLLLLLAFVHWSLQREETIPVVGAKRESRPWPHRTAHKNRERG